MSVTLVICPWCLLENPHIFALLSNDVVEHGWITRQDSVKPSVVVGSNTDQMILAPTALGHQVLKRSDHVKKEHVQPSVR